MFKSEIRKIKKRPRLEFEISNKGHFYYSFIQNFFSSWAFLFKVAKTIKTLRLKSLYSLVSLQSRDDTPAPPGGPRSRPSRGGRLSLWSREQSRLSVNCPSLSRVLSRMTAHVLIVKSVPRKENHCRIGSKIGQNIYIIYRILSEENQSKYY